MALREALADAGASVVSELSLAMTESAEKLADEINQSGGAAFPVRADVSNPADVDAIFDACRARFGTLISIVVARFRLAEG